MTKEEIAKRNCGYGNWEGIYKAMDLYAKQEAIEFAKWKEDEGWILSLRGKDKHYQKPVSDVVEYKTTEQLYNLFKGGEKE